VRRRALVEPNVLRPRVTRGDDCRVLSSSSLLASATDLPVRLRVVGGVGFRREFCLTVVLTPQDFYDFYFVPGLLRWRALPLIFRL
jgi:hypothetical protein